MSASREEDIKLCESMLYGNARGKHYGGNLHYIRNKKNKNKSETIVEDTKTDTAPPSNLNKNTTQKRDKPKKKHSTAQGGVDSAVLRSIFGG